MYQRKGRLVFRLEYEHVACDDSRYAIEIQISEIQLTDLYRFARECRKVEKHVYLSGNLGQVADAFK